MYDDQNELMKEILAGEDTYLEFKEVVFNGNQIRFASEEGKATKVIAEVLISFANTEGGVVLFGVNNFGEIIGVDQEKRDLLEQFIVNCALNNCEPKGSLEPRLNWRFLPDHAGLDQLILHVHIPKSKFYVHQTQDGRFLKRVGSHRTLIPAEQLGRLLTSRNLLIPFEERPVLGASIENFNKDSFDIYYQKRFGKSFRDIVLPLEKLLGNLKLAIEEDQQWKLTNIGVLLFSDSPQMFLSGAFIEVAVYDHPIADGNTKDVKRFTGSVVKQIEDSLAYLQNSPFIRVESVKTQSGRMDLPAYSGLALQEAIVNAVVHRDYELTGSQIIINLFPDRIEIKNPGALHNTLKPEDLYAGCQPMRRNQHLAGFLRDFSSPVTGQSLMEARGEGFLNIVRETEKLSGKKPILEMIGQSMKLTIPSSLENHNEDEE